MKRYKFFSKLLIAIILLFSFSACDKSTSEDYISIESSTLEDLSSQFKDKDKKDSIKEEKSYYSKDEVAEYLHLYNKLPQNYITKKEAKALGREPKEGNLREVTDKKVIGGDYFGNYENLLPKSDYKEADVNYYGGPRNAERLIFDQEGNIFYTDDHYESFERIY
jgi:ribonuclease T1